MPAERNAFKLGLAAILFLALLVAVLIFLAPETGGDLVLEVRFPHTRMHTLLVAGSKVSCGGQDVGKVETIRLQEMKNEKTGYPMLYTVVTFNVQKDIGLRRDCAIRPAEMLLGGMGKLVIEDRGQGEAVKPGQIIDGQPGQNIGDLTNMLAGQLDPDKPDSLVYLIQQQLQEGDPDNVVGKMLAILDDLRQVSTTIRNEFDRRQKDVILTKIHGILTNINRLSAHLREEMDRDVDASSIAELHRILDKMEQIATGAAGLVERNAGPIDETIAHIRNTARITEEMIARRIAEQLDPNEMAGFLAKAHVAVDNLNQSLADINVITGQAREVVVLSSAQIDGMVENLKQTSDHLKAAAREIRRSPWRLLYRPTDEELKEAEISSAARSFSDAAAELDDAVTRLKALMDTGGDQARIDRETLTKILEALNVTFDRFKEAENALWNELDVQ